MALLHWITLGCWLYWFVVYWGGGRLLARDIQHANRNASRLDTTLLIIITALILGLFFAGIGITLGWIAAPETGIYAPLALVGVLLTFGGMSGTFYCRNYLGRFWTADATLQTDHQVVDTGPYGLVRHPIYTTAIAMCLGAALVFPVWWTGLVFLGLLVTQLKTWDEDRFLAAQLPGYADYQQRVRYRLLSGLW